MNMPGGLAESAAATLVGLMAAELAEVETGYAARFAALDTSGDPRAARNLEARLAIDARCLEAALTTGLSEVANTRPVELGAGLHPMSPSQVRSRWRRLIESGLAGGLVRPAELNAFLAAFAVPAADGNELLALLAELDTCRRTLWHDTRQRTVLPSRDLERLRKLDAKRLRLYARIRSRYPVTVRAERVQTALERHYEDQRAALVAAQGQDMSTEDQAGYAAALEHLDRAYELALRRQSVPQYETPTAQTPSPPPAAAGQVVESVVAQMERQRAQLVRMRDQDLTAEGRAGYDQAIAQIDVGIAMTGRLPGPAVDAEAAMTDDQRRAAEQAIASVAEVTAQLTDLESTMRTAAATNAHMVTETNRLSGLHAEMHAATEERTAAHRAVLNAQTAVDSARRSGIRSDHRAATLHCEQTRQRLAAVEARIADLQARVEEQRQRLLSGPRDAG